MEPRNLSGIFFRTTVDDKWVNRVFEDLTVDEQTRVMDGKNEAWLKSLSKMLAESLRKIADQFDIMLGEEEKP